MSSNPIEQVLNWVRAGYPEGIPRQDYIALFAVLHRRLTEAEVGSIAAELTIDGSPALEDGAITVEEIEALISDRTLGKPGDDDVARVTARLAAAGWPLADPRADDKADDAAALAT